MGTKLATNACADYISVASQLVLCQNIRNFLSNLSDRDHFFPNMCVVLHYCICMCTFSSQSFELASDEDETLSVSTRLQFGFIITWQIKLL